MQDHTIFFVDCCPACGSMDGQAALITVIIFSEQQRVALVSAAVRIRVQTARLRCRVEPILACVGSRVG
jgi:hypothetical protein